MTKKISLFKKQIEFFNLQDREALLEAGISYGKSRVGSIWLAAQTQKFPRTKWFMAARDYRQLKTAIDQEFEFYLHDILGMERGKHYTKTNGSPIVYEWKNGSIIYGVGAHNYDTVFRAGSYSGAWCDEVDYWKPDAVKALRGRIRVYPELIRWTSSPKGYNHVHEDFYINKAGPVITATTMENPTLSDAFVQSLKTTYSPKMYEQEVLAKRLNLQANAVFSEFVRAKHVTSIKGVLDSTDQIYFFTDYNIANYCGVYVIFKEGILYVIGEEHLKFKKTKDMALKIIDRYPDRPIIVVGDSSGNKKRDVSAEHVNYEIFNQYGLLTKDFRNPEVNVRIIECESGLHHEKIIVDKSCTNLIKDLELLQWKEDGSGIDKSNIDLSHSADAFGYAVHNFLPIKPRTRNKIVLR